MRQRAFFQATMWNLSVNSPAGVQKMVLFKTCRGLLPSPSSHGLMDLYATGILPVRLTSVPITYSTEVSKMYKNQVT